MSTNPTPPNGVQSSMHPLRQRGRSVAATLLSKVRKAKFPKDASLSNEMLAGRWAISDTHIERLFNPESGVAMAFGDLLALPKSLAIDVLTAALAWLDAQGGDARREPSTPDTLMDISIALGKACEAYRADEGDNGRIDSPDVHAKHLGRIAALALRGQRLLLRAALQDAEDVL